MQMLAGHKAAMLTGRFLGFRGRSIEIFWECSVSEMTLWAIRDSGFTLKKKKISYWRDLDAPECKMNLKEHFC